jgi:8-oxo-dGTP pyrophosphatase MutT (NUDIX family)
MNWPALQLAVAHDAAARVPFWLGRHRLGSVARTHLAALSAWPGWLEMGGDRVRLVASDADAALASINAALRAQGLVRGWRNELCALVCPDTGQRLGRIERAAARFWGTLTVGAHCNGYVAGDDGRPTQLWIARRALDKATDPGQLDNLVGGGVPDGQTPRETLLREGWEEAGLDASLMRGATAGRVLRLLRDVPEGLQFEYLHVFDLALPRGLEPVNQDGEVQEFACLPLAEALALAAGESMTVDASLATLDFALRHALLPNLPPPGIEPLFVWR